MTEAALVFVGMFILNVLWSRYIPAVSKGLALEAALLDMGLIFVSGYTTILYVQNPVLLISALVGGGLGCYVTVKWSRK
jgi:hypothetical protein